ncbi:mitochondrial half-size ABC transporter [Cylindrobasidium torrendii FP15055 ss-10]|uniref:Mitochondrial half-size ABC transporter n=1 Tax=Cylindrobasidium torrendii FP15055 ss-10 TaxID=1314674 RepID=A0A0D7B9N8_9AGAR|nr:mitochondrial half-size ABC transporter [Cylindrobasidium torrendii FP15055 ss-10]
MPPPETLLVFALRVVSPALALLATTSFLVLPPSTPASSSSASPIVPVVSANRIPRSGAILAFLTLSALTYLSDGLVFVVFAVLSKQWVSWTGIEPNAIIGLVAFAGLAALGAWKEVHGQSLWSATRLSVALGASLALDVLIIVFMGLDISASGKAPSKLPLQVILHFLIPVARVLVLLPLLITVLSPRVVYTPVAQAENGHGHEATESSFLLPPSAAQNASTGLLAVPGLSESTKYGTFRQGRPVSQASSSNTRPSSPAPSHSTTGPKTEVSVEPSWGETVARLRRLSPYLWPSKSKALQGVAVICLLILVVGRFVNAAVPFILGELVKILQGGSGRSPWSFLGLYVVLRFLQGSGGLAALRESLWIPVMQYSDREMSQLSFDHLLNLSFAFHTRRKTGEILRVLDRGAAINRILELLLFNIVPTFADIGIALVVFIITFDWTLAVVIFVVMFTYVAASVLLTQWRTKLRRRMNERDIVTRGIHTDCLLNYETVKYFCGEEHENERYRNAINEYQQLEYQVMLSLNLLNLVQNFIITVGLLVGSLMVAHRVVSGKTDSSNFVVFIVYLGQLYGPLNQLGFIYRSINQSLIDTEKLLKLLNEPTEVNDKPGAPDLIVENGEIEFDNVNFSYDGRTTALNGVSFKVPKGSSVALVGESGSGKSTILRLFYRFYDLAEGQGRILIDGQDIRDVTQKSLRQAIGVVPQDSVLFNTTVADNIGYGRFGSEPQEIEDAARSAQMHDRIMTFPEGYNTIVGERGVRLSGGEKQRVAIARTLLKNPPILLLDEATSALDTSTEKDIQKALQNLVVGRSSLSIAHRLSTIASADLILVLKDGQIAEQGTFRDLVANKDGLFAAMWADQISSSEEPIQVADDPKEEASPYVVDDDAPPADLAQGLAAPSVHEKPASVAPSLPPKDAASTSDAPTAFPTSDAPMTFPSQDDRADDSLAAQPTTPPVTFPSSSEAPVSFPGGDTESVADNGGTVRSVPQSPGVTFENGPSDRDGTPNPDTEPKRKRISSQNFQRMARRISISTKRQGSMVSSIIDGLKRTDTPRGSSDEQTGSLRGESGSQRESPAPSVTEDGRRKSSKEDRKKLKRKSTAP